MKTHCKCTPPTTREAGLHSFTINSLSRTFQPPLPPRPNSLEAKYRGNLISGQYLKRFKHPQNQKNKKTANGLQSIKTFPMSLLSLHKLPLISNHRHHRPNGALHRKKQPHKDTNAHTHTHTQHRS